MPDQPLFLFPDTNVFIECKTLAELDWSDWIEFSEIHLVVCRPVQREIDKLKSQGNDRVGRRARAANGLFRKIIQSSQDHELIKGSSPAVLLYLGGPRSPSAGLDDFLDYHKPDDEIVGYLHRFRQDKPEADARLLTNDTGPMMTAKTLELPFVPIKPDWLLPPEHNTLERENARLQATITQLERAEPRFNIELVNDEGEKLEKLNLKFNNYLPLSEDDLRALLQPLSDHFPLEDDFGPRNPIEERILGMKRDYTPATNEAITKYTDQAYPKWIKDCENLLSNLHSALQSEEGRPTFTLSVSNQGTRPGNNALVHIAAYGNFKICPPADTTEEPEQPQKLALPLPPNPPRGRWKPLNQINKLLSARMGIFGGLLNPFPRMIDLHTLPMPTAGAPPRRDPNGFFYKPDRPTKPEESFAVECEQWRHQTGEEDFVGELFFDEKTEEIRGALKCEVHAENLSTPTEETFPVTITIKTADTKAQAQEIVQRLINSAMPPKRTF